MEKQLAGIKEYLLSLLKNDYPSVFLTDSLLSWTDLSWQEFSNELYSQGINVELSQKRDWEVLFLVEKDNYLTVKREIMKLENIKELREYLNLS